MSEATDGAPEDVRRRLVQRAAEDADFRDKLLGDPKATIEEEMGASLPGDIEIRVVEETAETVYLVLPVAAPANDTNDGELSDQELDGVAGGWTSGSGCTAFVNCCSV